MPLYEYECQACHRRTEKILKFSDPELTVCPHCGGALERTVTAPAFQFAGGGWYKDLYSSAKPAEGSGGDTGGKEAGGSRDAAAGPSSGGESSGGKTDVAAAAAPAPAAAPATASAPAAAPGASKA